METLQPYLAYLGIGAAIVGSIVLLLWIASAAMLSTSTEGIPELLGKFFNYLAIGEFEICCLIAAAHKSNKVTIQPW